MTVGQIRYVMPPGCNTALPSTALLLYDPFEPLLSS